MLLEKGSMATGKDSQVVVLTGKVEEYLRNRGNPPEL